MIRQCHHRDIEILYSIINEAAQKYKGVIPDDCWKIPYMPEDELKHEIDEGVVFWGFEVEGELIGVMGIQHIQDVTLIRHAYVRPAQQHQGIGKQLLAELCRQTDRPMLIGTWADAASLREKDRLLKKYWSISARQTETSIVLADKKWFDAFHENR
jgi:N-acetylglutamate synthase-like GNAT family acetyltransferase